MASRGLMIWTLVLLLPVCCNVAAARRLRGNSGPLNLWDVIQGQNNLSTLSRLVEAADLVSTLSAMTNTTMMFLPVDSAWENFFDEFGSNETTFINSSALNTVLEYHLFSAATPSDIPIFEAGLVLTMMSGDNVTFITTVTGDMGLRDAAGRNANFIDTTLLSGPRFIAHVIDRVLFPYRPSSVDQALAFNTQFSAFRQALFDANYTDLLNSTTANVTLLVPTNDAFATALDILNMTYPQLVENSTLLSIVVSAHILPQVTTWEDMANAYSTYFRTCINCAAFRVQQEANYTLTIIGQRVLAGPPPPAPAAPGSPPAPPSSQYTGTAEIIDEDRIAGSFALIQVLNAALLPLNLPWDRAEWCGLSCPSLLDSAPDIGM